MADNPDNRHPDYEKMRVEWDTMRDAADGDTAVKKKGTIYLPQPSGFTKMSDQGVKAYSAYAVRAQFPEITAPTIRGMTGVIHKSPATVMMPTAMEYLIEAATLDKLPLDTFHRRVTREILTTGRYGILTDIAEGGGLPYLAGYCAEKIINWSKEGDFFVLDETAWVRDGFDWVEKARFRVLELVEGKYTVRVFDEDMNQVDESILPQATGGKVLDTIPFFVAGSQDVSPDVDEVPVIGVARAAFAGYRLDADYRHQLYMSGQETLFIIGEPDSSKMPDVLGAGVIIGLPLEADAKYVGPSGSGIEAHRLAIQEEMQKAVKAGAKLFDTSSTQVESGEALKIRWAAQTATLLSVALSSAQALEKALRAVAAFMGLDPQEVFVTPNLSFIESTLTAADAEALVRVWQAGAISKQTLYENLQRGDIASKDRSFDDEEELIQEEIDVAGVNADNLDNNPDNTDNNPPPGDNVDNNA